MLADQPRRYMRSDEYLVILDRAARAATPAELSEMRAELRAEWPDDATAQLLNEVLLEYERSFDWPAGAHPQASTVWDVDPTAATASVRKGHIATITASTSSSKLRVNTSTSANAAWNAVATYGVPKRGCTFASGRKNRPSAAIA